MFVAAAETVAGAASREVSITFSILIEGYGEMFASDEVDFFRFCYMMSRALLFFLKTPGVPYDYAISESI